MYKLVIQYTNKTYNVLYCHTVTQCKDKIDNHSKWYSVDDYTITNMND